MSVFRDLSIRSTLGLVIVSMGLLLITTTIFLSVNAVTLSGRAAQVAERAEVSRFLFQTLQAFRLSRGGAVPALAAPNPAVDAVLARIADHDRHVEQAYAPSINGLAAMTVSGLPPVLARLRSSHDAMAALMAKVIPALRQPKSARDPAFLLEYSKQALDFMAALAATSDLLENSLRMFDPAVDDLIAVKRAGWVVRSLAGDEAVLGGGALSGNRPWTEAEMIARASARGGMAAAWPIVSQAAARADAPARLVDAVAKANDGFFGAGGAMLRAPYDALASGLRPDVSFAEWLPLVSHGLDLLGDASNAALDEMVARANQASAAALRSVILNGTLLIVSLLLSVSGYLLVWRRISNPIQALTSAMSRLAEKDTSVAIAGSERGDEIGAMARAVEVFKLNMIKADEMVAAQDAARSAKEQQAGCVASLVRDFQGKIQTMVGGLSSGANTLESTSQDMSGAAVQARQQAANVATAAQEASASVQTVAAAAEELSSSINEINRQITLSTKVIGHAVSDAQRTNQTVRLLAEAAEKIGQVVGLITTIAGQTNLLALNATIEAARAGDAGKGFAVVAGEVKSLASQTSLATSEISRHVSAIQGATKEAVAAISAISGTIDEISAISTTIAAAVEEQGAATSEIARNVQQTAGAAQRVTTNITGVSEVVDRNGAVAIQLQDAASGLTRQAGDLTSEVDSFIKGMRAA